MEWTMRQTNFLTLAATITPVVLVSSIQLVDPQVPHVKLVQQEDSAPPLELLITQHAQTVWLVHSATQREQTAHQHVFNALQGASVD